MSADPSPGRPGLVVLDTNVWISAMLSREGAPARVVRHVLDHGTPVFSPATFAELEDRLKRPKFDRYLSSELRRAILRDARASAHWETIPYGIAARKWCTDRQDDMFVHTALAASASWIITGDQALLSVRNVPGVTIVSPADALRDDAFRS